MKLKRERNFVLFIVHLFQIGSKLKLKIMHNLFYNLLFIRLLIFVVKQKILKDCSFIMYIYEEIQKKFQF